MFKKILLGLAFALTAAFASLPAFAAVDPSMQDVYQAAKEGRFIEAQSMMDQVLKEHPNSAKAHYVQAELLAKQGMLTKADTELRTAERLSPGLAFAKPDAVSKLKAVIAAPRGSANVRSNAQPSNAQSSQSEFSRQPVAEKGISWGLVAGGLGLIAFIFFATRFMRQRSAAAGAAAGAAPGYAGYAANGNSFGAGGNNFGSNPAMQPAPYGGAAPMGQAMAPAAGGGMGSGIMGGLATGAALGAGMVAGQALMHRFTDGDRGNAAAPAQSGNNWNPEPAPNDMGGNDFGIADSSSWDDGGSGGGGGGGDDWN